ncbi:MAG: nitrogenase iron-molybdenum cofactor biosynthesis protein NifE [Acetobacteraceae bacterium]|nr:nitrogenase iron-molybdenum cofactor biosynthesis protein NifE [Acetobacteraceae bacterium]
MGQNLHTRIADIFNEPGCDKNVAKEEKARKKGCSKPLTPGAAAGGCAFDGAKIALQPITDVVHLVHGPLACEGNGWDNRHASSSGPMLYRSGFTTDMTEMDIVMGSGEKRLYRAIKEAISKHNPPAVFVYATCVPALIGDDIDAVCRHASEKLGTPCIPVNAPGFVGSKNLGNKLAGEALLDHVIGTHEPGAMAPNSVNILGEYNLSGELWQIKPLLDALGINLHASITGDARYHLVASSHRAQVNMMVCSTALINVARKMQERYGIPYFEGSFYGISDTSEALRQLATLLVGTGTDAGLIARTEALIAAEEARAWARIAPYRARLRGKRVLLYTGGVKSWSVVSALQEIGMEIVSTSVRKSTDNDKLKIKELMGGDAHMVDSIPPREMYATLKRGDADIMLSGGRTQFVALKARTPWLDINQERHNAYAGYDGMVDLVHALDRAISNPVWSDLRRPAPWDDAPSLSLAAE